MVLSTGQPADGGRPPGGTRWLLAARLLCRLVDNSCSHLFSYPVIPQSTGAGSGGSSPTSIEQGRSLRRGAVNGALDREFRRGATTPLHCWSCGPEETDAIERITRPQRA